MIGVYSLGTYSQTLRILANVQLTFIAFMWAQEIDKYRDNLNNLFLMDCVSIPIVYTQVSQQTRYLLTYLLT